MITSVDDLVPVGDISHIIHCLLFVTLTLALHTHSYTTYCVPQSTTVVTHCDVNMFAITLKKSSLMFSNYTQYNNHTVPLVDGWLTWLMLAPLKVIITALFCICLARLSSGVGVTITAKRIVVSSMMGSKTIVLASAALEA